ncbi:hypothetical protein EDD18DRAFT_1312804 [Armillaria luteobubalina]|uniref:Uncharacterized protein n=1 Tax=Armillaria luteobubalina TaxID=153913 RepID=A0AA39P411_9AGAR|nr:hypothetical protein EDD18DRAFT_1312804 [Armillaria luteobubalina]
MDAYMEWVLVRNEEKAPLAEEGAQSSEGIWVIDIFRLVVTFHVMEILHAAILCCPQLLVQGFVQTLFSGTLHEQFSICYNVFIAILESVEHPDCMFRTMDGNNSLKHVPQSKVVDTLEQDWISIEQDDLHDDDRTSKMWGVFKETGFFLLLCCHRSVLLGADMVKSGDQLLEVFGERLGIRYDIGCKFGMAKMKGLHVLVGLFHGHAHNHLCQLWNLGTYLKGLGLEDLETLEHFFSKSNALTSGIRYASSFLCNNYRQALDIIDNYPALHKSMLELGITDEKEFEVSLKEEEAYLSGLQCEPLEKTVKMEYYMRLVHYYDIELKVTASQRVVFVNTIPGTQPQRSQELERVHDLEHSLSISPEECWTIGLEKWKENEQRVALRTYWQCLDQLEGLIVAHIFKLTKMNMSHTGYKMRKHIGKALKAWSQAIPTALSHYNAAASALCPPRPPLQWERVIKYAFLADFDLLQDVQENMTGCQATDTYFKICGAKEEIKHLNGAIVKTAPALALQISRYHQDRECFYATHMQHLYALSRDAGFTGSVEVGNSDAESDNSEDEDGEDAVHEQVQAIMQVSEGTTRE